LRRRRPLCRDNHRTGQPPAQLEQASVAAANCHGCATVPVLWALESRAPDFELLLSAAQLALLGQRRGQRSTLLDLHRRCCICCERVLSRQTVVMRTFVSRSRSSDRYWPTRSSRPMSRLRACYGTHATTAAADGPCHRGRRSPGWTHLRSSWRLRRQARPPSSSPGRATGVPFPAVLTGPQRTTTDNSKSASTCTVPCLRR
jgi:hypothetical protein